MFTGFASENTPGVKVWDFTRTQSGSSLPIASLEDDCAPNQIFFTGGSTNAISVYLPNASVAGKTITIRNEYTSSNVNEQRLNVFDNAQNQTGWSYAIGQGQTIVFLAIDNLSVFRASTSLVSCGWIILSGGQFYGGNNYGSSVLSGFNNRTNGSSLFAVVAGGSGNRTNGLRAAVVGGDTNLASGSNAIVAGGSSNTASGGDSAIVGGYANNASNASAFIGGGFGCNATNSYSSVVNGLVNTASGDASIVLGGNYGTTRGIAGNFVAAASVSPIAALAGAQQTATLLLGRQTTDATATRLRSNTGAAGTQNQVILPNNSAYYVKGSVIATVTGGGNTKSWDFIATIKRGANAAATSIVGAVTLNVQAADAWAATWIVAITADTTNGGLAVTVTGQAATTIRWVCKLESTEVTY